MNKVYSYLIALALVCTSGVQAETIFKCTVKDVVHLTSNGTISEETKSSFSPKKNQTFTISTSSGIMQGDVTNSTEGYIKFLS